MSEQPVYAYDLFISYAAADRAWVEGYLLDALTQAGVHVHSEATFALGVPRLLEFERAVQQSRRTLLVLSPATLAEGYSQFTDLLAQSYGLETATWPVIPLILQPADLSPRLAMLTALDATDPAQWPAVVERLCAELQHPVPDPASKPPCPYPGMVPFSEADSARFFGRDREVQDLLERLRLHPFLTIIGSSGSGKSSLVLAGLVPALRQSGLFGPGKWLVRTLRPGEAPLAALQAAGGDIVDLSDLQSPTSNLLLIVDQFEELFTQACPEDVEPFQQTLLRLSQTSGCYVMPTVRADFYLDLMACPLWPQIQAHRAEVLPLDEAGLRQAIVRPAEDVGVFVETALVERLVADAGREPGVLPLVQETLVLLWERVERRFLPLRAYEALVLPRAAYGEPPRTGLQVAMARRADAALAALTPDQQAIARRVFLRLVQFGEGRADTRRQQPVTALRAAGDEPALFDRTLHHLANHRLLTLSGEEQGADRKADIAHEALIGGWPTLQGWLAERREAEQTRRQLEAKAAEWVRLGQSSGGLLDEVELLEAERWLDSANAADLGYGEALPALAKASRAAQVEAAAQRRRAIQFRLGAVGAIAVLIMVILAVIAIGQSELARQQGAAVATATVLAGAEAQARQTAEVSEIEAREQARVATSRELAMAAIGQLEVDPELSLLLAMKAMETEHTPQAEDALRRALGVSWQVTLNDPSSKGLDSAEYSPDGRWIVTAGDKVLVWDVANGRQVRALPVTPRPDGGPPYWFGSAAYSPDGKWIAAANGDVVRVWNAATGQETMALPQPSNVNSVVYSPDGRQIAAVAAGSAVWILDAVNGQQTRELPHPSIVFSAAYSPDGQRIVTTCGDDLVRIWDAVSGRQVMEWPGSIGVHSATFSPDGQRIVTTSVDDMARVWDVATGFEMMTLRGHAREINSAVYSPDGRWIVTASSDDTAWIWDATDGQPRKELKHQDAVLSAAYSPDGHWIVTTCLDRTTRVWDATLGTELRGHTGAVNSAAYSPDGRWIVTASEDRTARVWDAASGQPSMILRHTYPIRSAAYSPDGRWIVTTICESGGIATTAPVWDAASGQLNMVLRGHTVCLNSAVYSPDGRWILTSGSDKTARVWDAASGQQRMVLTQTGYVKAGYSPDGRWIVTTGGSEVRVWDAANGQPVHEWQHMGYVFSADYSPDGRWIVTANHDDVARVWEAASGQEKMTLRGHTNEVRAASFSPDGQWIVTASLDRTARVWDAASGQQRMELQHSSDVNSAVYSPDGRWIVTASNDRMAQVWPWPDVKSLLAAAQSRIIRELTCPERQTYLHENITCPTPTPAPTP
ncbi:MAG: TIR domain-containing protein [Chloroflexi bacterium]|nr:TIR domain-containing protein [Chloroflexota bacterium]